MFITPLSSYCRYITLRTKYHSIVIVIITVSGVVDLAITRVRVNACNVTARLSQILYSKTRNTTLWPTWPKVSLPVVHPLLSLTLTSTKTTRVKTYSYKIAVGIPPQWRAYLHTQCYKLCTIQSRRMCVVVGWFPEWVFFRLNVTACFNAKPNSWQCDLKANVVLVGFFFIPKKCVRVTFSHP